MIYLLIPTIHLYHLFPYFREQIYSELEAIVDKLATESQRGSNTLRKQTSKALITYRIL